MTTREENEVISIWAGLECRCEVSDICAGDRYWGNCPRHANGGDPPDYDRDEVAIKLFNVFKKKGFYPELELRFDDLWELQIWARHEESEGHFIHDHVTEATCQPTIAAAIKKSILTLLGEENTQ